MDYKEIALEVAKNLFFSVEDNEIVEFATRFLSAVDAERGRNAFGYWHQGATDDESDFFPASYCHNARQDCPGCKPLFLSPTTQWISVEDRLPPPYDPKLKNPQAYLCYVEADITENIYGGYREICAYGYFEWQDMDGDYPDADEDGTVKRFGWHYERESEGEYDSLTFDMNGKVTHWMPLPDAPEGVTKC